MTRRAALLATMLAVCAAAGCQTMASPDSSTSTVTANATTSSTVAGRSTSTTSTVTTGALPAVQGDIQRVVNTNAMPTRCTTREAGNGQALPDPSCTPGVIATRVTQANIRTTICTPGYTATVRPPPTITDPLKRAAVRAYGLSDDPRIEYDHLIPLELGGANDVRNLWPEPPTSPNQHGTGNAKDDVENELHARVCNGTLTLAAAQLRIATDWTTATN